MAKLDFTASTADGEAKPGEGAEAAVLTLTAAERTEVTFQLVADGAMDTPVIKRQEDDQGIDVELAGDGKTATARHTVTAASYGTYRASAKIGNAPVNAVAGVKLAKPSGPANPPGNPGAAGAGDGPGAANPGAAGAGAGAGDGASELEVGELDRPFAYTTLAFVVLLAISVGVAVWSVISRVLLPDAGAVIGDDQVADGTFGQRAASIVLVLGAGIGGITLVIGAWLAAIETRGRLRAPIKGGSTARGAAGTTGLAAAELQAIAEILDKARRLRGSIAVVLAGFFILAISMWGVNALTGLPPAPAPTPTPTLTVTSEIPGPTGSTPASPAADPSASPED